MGLFEGKKGLILGVANEYSIAAHVAQFLKAQGATLGFNHLPDKEGRRRMEQRVRRVADPLDAAFVTPCDVSNEDDLDNLFSTVAEEFKTLDFLVHSVAFAPLEDIRCPTLNVSRSGFSTAMDVSVYSLISVSKRAAGLMKPGGSIVAMTYFGGEKVVGGYNLMGVCKAALDSTMQYLAYDLGDLGIRMNAVSAGPLKTLASSAVGDFSSMMNLNAAVAPLGRNVTHEEVGKAAGYLLSDLASGVTGEIMHVDAGYNIMGSPGKALERLGWSPEKK